MANYKVTVKQVIAMREERAHGGWTLYQLAQRYGVGHNTVSRITTGTTYPDLPGPITPKNTIARAKTCGNGHRLDHTNRRGGNGKGWWDCKTCHTIRNRRYRQRKKARAS